MVAVDRCADDPALDYPLATKADLEEVAARHGAAVRTVVGDVRSPSGHAAPRWTTPSATSAASGRGAVAGVISGGPPLWETADAQWDALFDVNVSGVRHLAAAAVPALLRGARAAPGAVRGGGLGGGPAGLLRLSAYSASKHAVIGLMRSLAADLAGTGHHGQRGVPRLDQRGHARCVAPPSTASPPPRSSPRHQLLERLLVPAEPAALIAWLCGPASSGVTGAALPVDGGMTTS